MAKKTKPESLEELSYEAGYARLQEILGRLESGETSLEESLKLYAQGAQLAAHCAAKLEEAELAVRRWQEAGDSSAFTEWSDE